LSFDLRIRQEVDDAFSQARRRLLFQRILNFFTRHQEEGLLSFDRVREKLRIRGQRYVGLQTIPIDRIVGSVGRYQEFNRAFLPTQEHIRERWKHVYEVAQSPVGFPPIEVYRIGDVYFVRDGHHRVSVLKELGAPTVEAMVTELETPIRLSPDTDESDLDRKAEYSAFLQETDLDRLQPDQEINFTLPGQYQKLHEHIAVHRYFLGLREQHEVSYSEAVARWYAEVYLPAVQVIREEGVLTDFPGRTEADLYMWIIEHRHYLTERYGREVPMEQAAVEFSKEFSRGAGKKQLAQEVRRAEESGARPERFVAVFGSGSALAGDPVIAQAERLGHLLADEGFTVISGGYGGTMEAVSRGARQAGGRVIGVTMDLLTPPLKPNAWLTEEQRVSDFFPRLRRLVGADAFVVLRGGIGTLTEATLVWSLLQTGQILAKPFVFVGDSWQRLFDAFQAETFITERDFALVKAVGDVDEAYAVIKHGLAPSP
jgi:uncharacterized protein (TIGR00730 family)